MNTDVEFHIRQNYPWTKLPANVKQVPCFNVFTGQGEGETAVSWGWTCQCHRGALCHTAAVSFARLANLLCRGFTIQPEPQLAIFTLQPLTTLASHDRPFDRWRHMILARGCTCNVEYCEGCLIIICINPSSCIRCAYTSNIVVKWRRVYVHNVTAAFCWCLSCLPASLCACIPVCLHACVPASLCASSPVMDYQAEKVGNCSEAPYLQGTQTSRHYCVSTDLCLYNWKY